MIDAYFTALISLLRQLQQSQQETITKVALAAAEAISEGGVLHLLDNGHFLRDELINRAGGLGLLNKLNSPAEINHTALVRRGDMVFLGSVSGRSVDIVKAAISARRRNVTSVALTSLAQARMAEPAHSSGQLLKDVADYVLDIGGLPGDGMLSLDGVESRFCPSSGIAAAAVMWATMAEIVSVMTERGNPPTIFTSVNVPGGQAAYERQLERLRVGGV